jgi:hypothetical protein
MMALDRLGGPVCCLFQHSNKLKHNCSYYYSHATRFQEKQSPRTCKSAMTQGFPDQRKLAVLSVEKIED